MDAIATAPGAIPLVGHAIPLLRDPLAFLTSLPGRGGLVRIRIGPFTAIVVCDPELNRQVLLDDRTFDKGGLFFDRIREVFGNGVAACAHHEHRRQRRLIQPAFHPTRLAGYARTMADQIAAVTGSWRDGQTIDVSADMRMLTARIIIATMLGGALSPAATDQIIADLNVTVAGVYRRLFQPPPLDRIPTAGNRRLDRARAHTRSVIGQAIADHRVGGTDRGDVLSMLLTTPGDLPPLADDEIVDQVITFFGAGTETTAAALTWALHLLAHHPTVQDGLHAEVRGRPADFEHLPQLELTRRIVTETLRMYPPAWFLTRVTSADTHLGGHFIPAGTTMVYTAYLIHHRSDLYPDPEHFDPDRWLDADTGAVRGALVPFGDGARKCAGETFALTEATLTLATIAAQWRLDPIPGQRLPRPAVSGSLLPRKGARLRVTPR